MFLVLTEVRDSIGIITLNHPKKHNALSKALVDAIIAALADFRARKLRVAILRAPAGSKVWSAGHDVNELPLGGRDPLGWSDPLRELIREIENFPAPVIAMIEGGVWGGACETAFACDLIVATPEATFAITPARLGVPYNIGGMLTFLNAASLRIAKEMASPCRSPPSARSAWHGQCGGSRRGSRAAHDALAAEIAANAPPISVMKEQLRIPGAHPMSPQGFERVQGIGGSSRAPIPRGHSRVQESKPVRGE
jgi:methylmalonyl-CoA decarboxylase